MSQSNIALIKSYFFFLRKLLKYQTFVITASMYCLHLIRCLPQQSQHLCVIYMYIILRPRIDEELKNTEQMPTPLGTNLPSGLCSELKLYPI